MSVFMERTLLKTVDIDSSGTSFLLSLKDMCVALHFENSREKYIIFSKNFHKESLKVSDMHGRTRHFFLRHAVLGAR